ncbi:MAG: DUF1460 domain-containing protein [Prevotella sp.]|nr:DUF1460 domain-containing protein [Prevotella sp.]
MTKTLIIALLLLFCRCFAATGQEVLYFPEDSLKVVRMLAEAPVFTNTNEYISYFGQRFTGAPYAEKTLEQSLPERLVINLRQFDCTTFVETVLALSLCKNRRECTFEDFCRYLRLVRYAGGEPSYERRLHYFTSWIEAGEADGYVFETGQDGEADKIFTAVQTLDTSYMTAHPDLYPPLKSDGRIYETIAETERNLTGRQYRYIPREVLARNPEELKQYIRDGDIIAIVTNKKGLDIAHTGIAVWHSDGRLHLLDASRVHKKVTDETVTLYDYMLRNASQTGIRIVRMR